MPNCKFSVLPGIPKNGSVPSFDRVRKHSTGDRFKPSLAAIKASSRADVENGEVRMNTQLKRSTHSLTEGTLYTEDSVSSNTFYTSTLMWYNVVIGRVGKGETPKMFVITVASL